MKERIAYIDVAKGMLMLCLLWGHQIIELRMHGVENATLEAMWKLVPLYNAFFMQTFGAGSLLIYLINEPQQRFVLKFMLPLYSSDMHPAFAGLFDLAVYAMCVALFYVVVKVVYQNKYLSCLVGKW